MSNTPLKVQAQRPLILLVTQKVTNHYSDRNHQKCSAITPYPEGR